MLRGANMDYMIKATAGNGMIRAFAANSKNTVAAAKNAHGASRVVTAALGRLLTASFMMGSMMKNEEDVLTIRVEGSGPMRGMIVTANAKGEAKGYPFVSDVRLPANAAGKLDVAEAVGIGVLTVTADLGMKEPYVGQVELATSEIAEDIAYYYAVSEQIHSSVGLGVSFTSDGTVENAGGFIIQLMPFCTEEVIQILEKNLAGIKSVTEMLGAGLSIEKILEKLLAGLDIQFTDRSDIGFVCDCGKEKVSRALIGIGKKELEQMIAEGEDIEVKCHFCNKGYLFSVGEIEELLHEAL